MASGTEALLKLTDSKNFELANDVKLEEGATYVLTVDLTAGNDKAVISFKKISDGEVKPQPTLVQTLYFDLVVMKVELAGNRQSPRIIMEITGIILLIMMDFMQRRALFIPIL